MTCKPKIDSEKCTGCGLCCEVCRFRALVVVDNVVRMVGTDECDWCTECEAVCAEGAITCPFEIVAGD